MYYFNSGDDEMFLSIVMTEIIKFCSVFYKYIYI